MSDEQVMYLFHSKMNYLNSDCVAGRIRTYDVFVGGRKCMSPEHIEIALEELFQEIPATYKEIKDWHVRFEKIHPFWDWNGRTGRLLMLRQFIMMDIPPPFYLRTTKNFYVNRRRYYRWFK